MFGVNRVCVCVFSLLTFHKMFEGFSCFATIGGGREGERQMDGGSREAGGGDCFRS